MLVLIGFSAFISIAALCSTTDAHLSPAITVHPGDNIEALVSKQPPGTTFDFDPGIYRLVSIIPKNGDAFIGRPGAVLSGAELLTSYRREGPNWVVSARVNRQAHYRGVCQSRHPACMFPQDLFVNDRPLERVSSLAALGTGKWFLDYSTGKAYFRVDPRGQKLEISIIPHAFSGMASNVVIRGLTIEQYADVAGEGAIQGQVPRGALTEGWTVEDNVLRWNHGMAIRAGDHMQILNNKIIDNGQLGLGGSGEGVLVAGNEIADNNYAGYSYNWEAGGAKFLFTKDLVVRDNYVHNNDGPGLWTDTNNINTLYEGNHTSDNREAGILHEISHHAVIRDNIVEDDGFNQSHKTSPWYGAGILISTSDGVDVYGNTVVDCMNGIIGIQANRRSHSGQRYFLKNLYVHNNEITQANGIAAGIVRSAGFDDSVFRTRHNRFTGNIFHLNVADGRYFAWMNSFLTFTQWKSNPHG